MQVTSSDSPEAPAISVVMPTYNTPIPYLQEAVESVLNQTFRDFELVVIDDCSTNGSDEYLKKLRDERIKIIWNKENLGVTKSLNIGLKAVKGKYIARMDADDVSAPNRLEKQFAFLEAHPDVVLVGSYYEAFSEHFSKIIVQNIKSQSLYRIKSLFRNPGPAHPTLLIRREAIELHRVIYDESLIYAQDYGLFVEMCKYGDVAVFPEILVKKRVHKRQICVLHRKKQRECDQLVQKKLLEELDLTPDKEALDFHYRFRYESIRKIELYKGFKWILKLNHLNFRLKKYRRLDFLLFSLKVFIGQFLMLFFDDAYKFFYKITHQSKI